MKQLATIGAVVVMLLGAALYFGSQQEGPDEPVPVTPGVATPEKPEPDKPRTKAKADGTLTMSAALSHGYLENGNAREVFASVDIDAIKHEGSKRPPLNIAVVVDRSGSMSGDRIRYSKEAAMRLVNILTENDRVALITYGSDVRVDFPSAKLTHVNRESLKSTIDRISVGGGTNLSGGFQQGYSQVSSHKTLESVNRVIVMSDGHANVGMTSISELSRLAKSALEASVSVTTMGVGLDYNEDLMARMAIEGSGNYHFIESSQTIAGIFENELKGLASTIARNTSLAITLADGVELSKLFGFSHTQSGPKILVPLAEFYSEQNKGVLLKLNVPSIKTGEFPIVDIDLSYDDVISEKPTHSHVSLKAVGTDDPKLVEKHTDVDVIARVQQVDIAEAMKEAMHLYESGDVETATKKLESTQQVLKKRRTQYDFEDDAAFGRVDQEMEEVTRGMKKAKPASAGGRQIRKRSKKRSIDIIGSGSKF